MKEQNYITLVLKHLIVQEKYLLREEERELEQLPNGYLVTRKKNNKLYYTLCDSLGEHGITKDKTLIHDLSRKQFLINSISIHKKIHSALSNCLTNIATITKSPSLDKQPTNYNKQQLKWSHYPNSQNNYLTEQLIYKCNNGLMVRSKSERIIANKLYEYGIIFKYESPLSIDGKDYYPDFTILRNDGRIVLWEHNGLMSNEDYLFRTIQKIRKYKKAGFVQHTNLICTEEDDIRDEKTLDEIILKFILF